MSRLVPERDYGSIGRCLDGGASGIVAARIETAAQAAEIARACRFAPRGQRSQIAMVPQLGFVPTPASVLNPVLDRSAIVQVLIETPLGVSNAQAIAVLQVSPTSRNLRLSKMSTIAPAGIVLSQATTVIMASKK